MTNSIHALYASSDLTQVISGIRKFIRALGLEMPSHQFKRMADEFDLISALEMIPVHVQDSASLLGRTKYKSAPYVFTDEVKKDMEEWLLVGRDPKETALMRHRNLSMYHLVIEPTIDLLGKLEHKTALSEAKNVITEVIELIRTSEDYGDNDDAIIAKEQIAAMIKARTEARKQAQSKRIPKRKYKANELEHLPEDELVAVVSSDPSELIFE